MTGHTQQVPPGKPIDWPLVVLTCTRIAGVVCMLLLTYSLYQYSQIAPDPASLLPSIGQYLMACFFLFLLLTTPKRMQAFNALFLLGLFGVLAIF